MGVKEDYLIQSGDAQYQVRQRLILVSPVLQVFTYEWE